MKKVVCLLISLGFIVGCEEKEDDQIYSAQLCMDRATDGPSADVCLAKIEGISTPRAFVLRCSAEFLRANITTPTITQAIKNIKNNNSGNSQDPTIEFYDQFSFASTASADQALEYCTASGSPGLELLALSARTATIIKYEILGGAAITLANLNGYVVNPSDNTDFAQIGENLVQLKDVACGATGSLKNTEVCDNITSAQNSAVGTPGDAAYYTSLGQQFLDAMKNNNNTP